MSGFRVVPIPDAVAAEARASGRSPGYGHPIHAEQGDGPWPCRICLRREHPPGEERLLLTYDAFHGLEPLPLPGPIYVHRRECERFAGDDRFPDDLRRVPLTLNAYAAGRRLLAQEYVTDGRVEPLLRALLARPEVAYLHLRHTGAGCYLARVERAAGATGAPAGRWWRWRPAAALLSASGRGSGGSPRCRRPAIAWPAAARSPIR